MQQNNIQENSDHSFYLDEMDKHENYTLMNNIEEGNTDPKPPSAPLKTNYIVEYCPKIICLNIGKHKRNTSFLLKYNILRNVFEHSQSLRIINKFST